MIKFEDSIKHKNGPGFYMQMIKWPFYGKIFSEPLDKRPRGEYIFSEIIKFSKIAHPHQAEQGRSRMTEKEGKDDEQC